MEKSQFNKFTYNDTHRDRWQAHYLSGIIIIYHHSWFYRHWSLTLIFLNIDFRNILPQVFHLQLLLLLCFKSFCTNSSFCRSSFEVFTRIICFIIRAKIIGVILFYWYVPTFPPSGYYIFICWFLINSYSPYTILLMLQIKRRG